MKCSCGKEIEANKLFNLVINNEVVNVCEDCWWNSLNLTQKDSDEKSI